MWTRNEIKMMFANTVVLRKINALLRTSREFMQLLTPYLYRRAIHVNTISGRPYLLDAVDTGNHPVVK
jgi:hypothetical protein